MSAPPISVELINSGRDDSVTQGELALMTSCL